MRIGIDGYNFAMPHGTGIASYGVMLARTLATMGHSVEGVFGIDPGADPSLHEVLFYERFANGQPGKKRSAFRRLMAKLPRRTSEVVTIEASGMLDIRAFADRLPPLDKIRTSANLFDRAIRRFRTTGKITAIDMLDPPEVMHWTYPVPLRINGAANIYTVHDLVPLRLPHTTLDHKPTFKALVSACIDEAAQICTVSQASLQDIVQTFPRAADRVFNTYQISGLWEGTPAPIAEGLAALRGFGLEEQGYFLFFGAIEPKKNVGRLIQAYLNLHTKTPLVLVSSRSWQSDQELLLVAQQRDSAGRSDEQGCNPIIRLDHVPKSILRQLITHAKAVVFPSLYEGFGLPAHEAMLLGTPVLASLQGGLSEVVGDNAVIVDPYNVSSICDGLARLDTNSVLRSTLAVEGKAFAGQFSAARYREALNELYARALACQRGEAASVRSARNAS